MSANSHVQIGDLLSKPSQLDELSDDTLIEDANNIFFFKNIYPAYDIDGELIDHYWIHCFGGAQLETTDEITLPARIRYTP